MSGGIVTPLLDGALGEVLNTLSSFLESKVGVGRVFILAIHFVFSWMLTASKHHIWVSN